MIISSCSSLSPPILTSSTLGSDPILSLRSLDTFLRRKSETSPLTETTKIGKRLKFTSLTTGSSASDGRSDFTRSTFSLVSSKA